MSFRLAPRAGQRWPALFQHLHAQPVVRSEGDGRSSDPTPAHADVRRPDGHAAHPRVPVPPTPRALFWSWLMVGLQSFGGGAATLLLIREIMVVRRGWISDAEFTRYWAICQLAPGINLLGLTVLIGWDLIGALGSVLSLLGLLLPSIGITIVISVSYASIRTQPAVQSALHGIIPATVGMGLVLVLHLARPLLAESRREGRSSLALSCTILAGAALVFAIFQPPTLAVLWGGGALSALAVWWQVRKQPQPAEPPQEAAEPAEELSHD